MESGCETGGTYSLFFGFGMGFMPATIHLSGGASMYKLNSEVELSAEQVDRIRRGYFAMLARRRFPPDFIENHADDVLAKAHLEYVRCEVRGDEIEEPITWVIHCAWRRAQTFVTAPKVSREVTIEKLPEQEDREAPTTEQLAEDLHRAREIRRAVDSLKEQEQQVIALTYLEGMSVREAGRRLDWPEAKARRRFKSAVKHLEEFFEERGITSSDELEIGLASFLASTCHSSGILAVAFEKTADAAALTWEKAHDLSRRIFLGGGGDAAGVAASSGAGRAAGACATVAIACVVGAGASGVVGPGIDGGIGLVSGHHQSEAKKVQSETTTEPPSLETSPVESAESEAPPTTSTASDTEAESSESPATPASTEKPAPRRVGTQIAGESGGHQVRARSSSTATDSSAQSDSAGSSASTTTQTAAPATKSEAQAAQQFGGP
jgi:RNA polymerase sigma factor (sigma-70 family)